jgi:hypothetical protein
MTECWQTKQKVQQRQSKANKNKIEIRNLSLNISKKQTNKQTKKKQNNNIHKPFDEAGWSSHRRKKRVSVLHLVHVLLPTICSEAAFQNALDGGWERETIRFSSSFQRHLPLLPTLETPFRLAYFWKQRINHAEQPCWGSSHLKLQRRIADFKDERKS